MNHTTVHKKMPVAPRGGRMRYNKPCERCGQMMHNVGFSRKYCDDCAVLVKREQCSAARKAGYPGGKACASIKAYKQAIDGLIFISPREIPYDLHGMKIDYCERPLRASTPQGERVSIAKSESVPAGSTAEFEIECLDPGLEAMVRECLDYGQLRGLGQWRNSGKGRYEWEEL